MENYDKNWDSQIESLEIAKMASIFILMEVLISGTKALRSGVSCYWKASSGRRPVDSPKFQLKANFDLNQIQWAIGVRIYSKPNAKLFQRTSLNEFPMIRQIRRIANEDSSKSQKVYRKIIPINGKFPERKIICTWKLDW